MRSRSSRLFIVLLHLVGVSTNVPRRHGSHLGIVGVNPMAILLERLQLQEFDDGLDGLLRQAGAEFELLLEEPYWLQDDVDGTCFGPAGFSECGDATLWRVRRRPQQRKRFLSRMFGREERDWGYALQLVDDDFTSSATSGGECLVRRRRSRLGLGKCTNPETAWSWRVSAEGILFHGGGRKLNPSQCLWRNDTLPVLSSCEDEEDSSYRLVRFSMVRYHTSSETQSAPKDDTREVIDEVQPQEKEEVAPLSEHHPVKSVDLAHSHASGPLQHPELKPESQLLSTPLSGGASSKPHVVSHKLLKAASPALLVHKETVQPPPPVLDNRAPVKLRRMPTHPYIAASKNEVWTDPQTDLEYPTDLHGYLGHDRKESGRHTLTGVGQYMRTVFNIKIYGVALYVSKRDVLADPLFEPYASLTAEELRSRPDFFSHLRHMPSPLDERGGLFDRTLLLKLNMQLSTDTMRSTLEADWKMLTDEAKKLLINSSLKPRPAEENMLSKIESEENPSRCSCGQVAPDEYKADPSCCSRGTELVFTWRKNGDLEIRLDGRVMDIFPRPDIAQGIFFEYLRCDDPMSMDFLDRVIDGFPFLLAPLAQVKGVSMPSSISDDRHEERGILRAVGGFADMMTSQAENFGRSLHDGANAMASRASHAVQSAGDTARHIAGDMERRREVLWRQVSSLPESSFNFVASRLQPNRRALTTLPTWLKDMGSKPELKEEEKPRRPGAPRGRAFGSPLVRWLGETQEAPLPDEIGPMIHPTMNFTRKVFLAMVHLYLLLLLIVSLPENTRTRLVVRRKRRAGRLDSKSEARGSLLAQTRKQGVEKRINRSGDECSKGNIKKSLSYFL